MSSHPKGITAEAVAFIDAAIPISFFLGLPLLIIGIVLAKREYDDYMES